MRSCHSLTSADQNISILCYFIVGKVRLQQLLEMIAMEDRHVDFAMSPAQKVGEVYNILSGLERHINIILDLPMSECQSLFSYVVSIYKEWYEYRAINIKANLCFTKMQFSIKWSITIKWLITTKIKMQNVQDHSFSKTIFLCFIATNVKM